MSKCWVQVANEGAPTTAALRKIEYMKLKKAAQLEVETKNEAVLT